MDIQRIGQEVQRARDTFAYVEVYATNDGGVYVKSAFQTSAGRTYIVDVNFHGYPHQMPRVDITAPELPNGTPHRYQGGNICYLHPNYWNPGRQDLAFVLARTVKWLNKYDVWRENGNWPGAQLGH